MHLPPTGDDVGLQTAAVADWAVRGWDRRLSPGAITGWRVTWGTRFHDRRGVPRSDGVVPARVCITRTDESRAMSDDRFTTPDEASGDWVDVRMQDPDEGEWELDAVVLDGQVEYVDLRIRPELLTSFVGCFVEDLDDAESRTMLSTLAARHDIEVTGKAEASDESGAGDEGAATGSDGGV